MPTNLHPQKKEPTIDEYGIAIDQEVDLGFPSGTIWAGWNLGATMPEEFGDYYACGETETKTEYSLSNYSHWIDKNEDGYISGTTFYPIRGRYWSSTINETNRYGRELCFDFNNVFNLCQTSTRYS